MDPDADFLQAVNVADQARILAYITHHDPVNVCNSKGYTALHIATVSNSGYLIQLMTKCQEERRPGSVRNWVNKRTVEGWTCLHFAAKQGKLATAEALVALGADANQVTDDGASILHMAAQGDHPELIAYFHEELRLSLALCDYQGNTPLHYAAHEGAEQAVSLLLIYCKQLLDMKNNRGNRPLHIAAAAGQLRATRLLMSQGADLHALVPVT